MSFRCEVCKCAQPDGASPEKIVTETRDKIYEPVLNPDKTIKKIPVGKEIVKEVVHCERCIKERRT